MDQDMTCSFEHTENRYLVKDGGRKREMALTCELFR